MRSALVMVLLATCALACTGPERAFADAPIAASSATGTTSGSGGSGGSGGAGTGGVGGSGGAACADATHVCIEKAPSGWVGPIALYQGDGANGAPPCGDPYPDAVAEYKSMIDEGTPVCGCTCSTPSPIVCSTSAQLCYPGSGLQACNIVCMGTKTALPPNACVPIPSSASTNVSVTNPAPTQMGTCTETATKDIPTPTWGIAAKACGGGETTDVGCGAGEICAPAGVAPFDSLCIVHAGDVDCPGEFYATKSSFFDSFTEGRDCSACSCGPADSKCGGHVDFQHANTGPCAAFAFSDGSVNAGSCGGYNMGFDSGTYVPAPTGMCPPMGGQLTGSVALNGATTICCH